MAKAHTYHHYVPRVYLNKFGIPKDSNWAYVRYNSNQKFFVTSLDKICGEDHLYRMPDILKHLSEEEKLTIEKGYYAEIIEGNYPRIYNLLIDERVGAISKETKEHILMMPISLFFRHPVHLQAVNYETDSWLEHIKAKVDRDPKKSFMVGASGVHDWVNQSTFEEYKQRVKAVDKMRFLSDQIRKSVEVLKRKMNCGISVLKLESGDFNYITCDKPVSFRIAGGERFGDEVVYDEKASIYLPIDDKHLLMIMPESEKSANPLTIARFTSSKKEALVNNYVMEQQAEKWIIGNEASVTQHVIDQKNFNELTPENLKMVEDTKATAALIMELGNYMEEKGIATNDPEIYRLVMKCKQSGLFEDDANFKQRIKEMEQYFGYKFE